MTSRPKLSPKLRNMILFTVITFLLEGCAGIALQTQFLSSAAASEPQETQATLVQQITQTPTAANSAPTATPLPTFTPLPTATHQPTPTPTVTPYAYGPYAFAENVNPLTGSAVEAIENLDRRPMAIKITNFPRSVRPQWGLSRADHVYEYYIGDDMSRFIGVFYGQDAERIGPIRSARLFDEEVVRMYNAIFVFGWADDPVLVPFIESDLLPHLVVERPDNCPPLCRIGPKYAYNNLYTGTRELVDYLIQRGTNIDRQDLTGLRFERNLPPSGNPAESLSIRYSAISYNRWEYDPLAGRYQRFQETGDDTDGEKHYAPLKDSLTEAQLSADNVVVLHVPHEYFYKSSDTEIFDQPIEGQGSGYALREGFIYPIQWRRPDAQKLVTLYLPNGMTYPLKPGNVWFEVVGDSSEISLPQPGSWQVDFSIP
jgi:hypothetical protein